MPSKAELRELVRNNLDSIGRAMNATMQGKDLDPLEPVLARVGRGKVLPHWYAKLKENGTLPNLDGKTVGSVIEMLLVAVLETRTFQGLGVPSLKINPARGVDLPDLYLGIKSPSENYCTSEPFFSAYERLLGSEHDIVVLLTDYQTAKKRRGGLRLQLLKWRYLNGSQVADENLCYTARAVRGWLLPQNEAWTIKVFRFLAFVNQRIWLAKQLLKMVAVLHDEAAVRRIVAASSEDFERKNREALRSSKIPNPESDLDTVKNVLEVSPIHLGVIDTADNWVNETQKEAGRLPNSNEWNRLKTAPFDGVIGMSFALQWRYSFKHLFTGIPDDTPLSDNNEDAEPCQEAE